MDQNTNPAADLPPMTVGLPPGVDPQRVLARKRALAAAGMTDLPLAEALASAAEVQQIAADKRIAERALALANTPVVPPAVTVPPSTPAVDHSAELAELRTRNTAQQQQIAEQKAKLDELSKTVATLAKNAAKPTTKDTEGGAK